MSRISNPAARLVGLVVVAVGMLSGCETTSGGRGFQPDVVETLRTEGTNEVTVKQGEPFGLDLPGNTGTGYTWMIHGALPSGLREVAKPFFRADDPDRMGASGVMRFGLLGEEPGDYDLAFEMRRVWETDEAPVRRAVVKVTVIGD